MRYNKINLALTAILVIVLYFTIPQNNAWLYDKILGTNTLYEVQHLDENTRKEYRYGSTYDVYQELKNCIPNPAGAVILFPPQQYLAKIQVANFTVPEPAVFYYFTGVRSVWVNSPDVQNANLAMTVNRNGRIILARIKSRQYLDTLLTIYKPYLSQQ